MQLDNVHRDFDSDLVNIIRYYGVSDYDAHDISIEFYLKVDGALKNGKANIIYKDSKLNKPYLFSIVRNIIYANYRNNNKVSFVEVDQCSAQHYDKFEESREELMMKAIEEIPSHFDRRLIKVYVLEGFTIRGMAGETGLSPTTIFHSLKKSKEFIKHKILNYEGTV